MIGALVLALVQTQEPHWEVTPREAQLGLPIELVLTLPEAGKAGGEPPELELDYGWAILDGPRRERRGERWSWHWTLAALEAGERTLPALTLEGGDEPLTVPETTLTVQGVLAADEDAPRPLPAFRTVEERTSPVRPTHILGFLAGMGLLAAALFVLRRRRRRKAAPLPSSPLERLADLDREQARSLAIELTSILRSATEESLGLEPRPASTDEEWLAALEHEGRLDPGRRRELGELLELCHRIKFAGWRPTRFAIDELVGRTEALLRRLVQEVEADQPREEALAC